MNVERGDVGAAQQSSRSLDEQIDSLGASVLTIRSQGFFSHGVGRSGTTLTIADSQALTAGLQTVSGAGRY